MADDIVQSVPPVEVASPCTLVCTLDLATGWCLGCGRTGGEIAEWSAATAVRRQAILDALPDRMARLSALRY